MPSRRTVLHGIDEIDLDLYKSSFAAVVLMSLILKLKHHAFALLPLDQRHCTLNSVVDELDPSFVKKGESKLKNLDDDDADDDCDGVGCDDYDSGDGGDGGDDDEEEEAKNEEISSPIFLQNFVPPLDIIPIFFHAPLHHHHLHHHHHHLHHHHH